MFASWILNSLAILGAAYIIPGVTVDSFLAALFISFIFALVNIFVKPLIVILTLPVTILTLGLFLLVINACMILLVDNIVAEFHVETFWWALLFSIVVSVFNSILQKLKIL